LKIWVSLQSAMKGPMPVMTALMVRQTRPAVISGMLNRLLWLTKAVRRILFVDEWSVGDPGKATLKGNIYNVGRKLYRRTNVKYDELSTKRVCVAATVIDVDLE